MFDGSTESSCGSAQKEDLPGDLCACIDAGSEAARKAMWAEEKRILSDVRGAYFIFHPFCHDGTVPSPVTVQTSGNGSGQSPPSTYFGSKTRLLNGADVLTISSAPGTRAK
jgi:hypothetical protein